MGEGVLRPSLENLIAELGISNKVKLVGWKTHDELHKLYADSHIFILSSVTASDGDKEGQGLVLQEAQAMGLPVLSTLHNGIPDGVLDGKSGFLVPERDVDALAEKLNYLVEHPEVWSEMGLAGRKFVEQNYDINKLNDKLVQIYQDLLDFTTLGAYKYMLKLNLGCGDQNPDGWVNVDYALGAWLFKIPGFKFINKKLKLFNLTWSDNVFIHNLCRKLPWADNSVDVIYSSHTLEHLSKEEGLNLLRECYRVLNPNGTIRIVVPDLKCIVDSYQQEKIAADEVLDSLKVGYSSRRDGFWKQKFAPFIRSPHKCMYDDRALLRIMSEIGFEVASKNAFESDIEDINTIEKEGRTKEAVIVEGIKIKLNTTLLAH